MTQLESVISGEWTDLISVPSKVPNDITLVQRHVDLNNQNICRYNPWGRNKDHMETDDDRLASSTPRFSLGISSNIKPEPLINTNRLWFQDAGRIQLEVGRNVIFQAKQAAVLFRQSAKNSTVTIAAETQMLLDETTADAGRMRTLAPLFLLHIQASPGRPPRAS